MVCRKMYFCIVNQAPLACVLQGYMTILIIFISNCFSTRALCFSWLNTNYTINIEKSKQSNCHFIKAGLPIERQITIIFYKPKSKNHFLIFFFLLFSWLFLLYFWLFQSFRFLILHIVSWSGLTEVWHW